ncbi:MAG: hypothetical protein VR66_07240 [Peptococcaceae bacterium BRH_c23]|nr:MAG: hypothetical protein VR66_07240 [Peptococcaceae bacterium BRH_c23]KJS77830.1 MAG: hypothetical protein JL57_32750 [Desulfosporosinus sp. BICA1-9]HBW38516.1 hypothetical protein [Desulfosporosinus sp.]
MDAIKGCNASLWTPRAVAYRRKKNINDLELLPAVVIMEMVKAQASGVAFSCDPQSGRRDMLVIKAIAIQVGVYLLRHLKSNCLLPVKSQ